MTAARLSAAARPLLVGVDVGGTKIAVLITTPDGAILGRATRASSAGDQDGAAEAIATTVETKPTINEICPAQTVRLQTSRP